MIFILKLQYKENIWIIIMAKRLIRLTEGDIHNIIKESVQRILKERVGDVVRKANKAWGGVYHDKTRINVKFIKKDKTTASYFISVEGSPFGYVTLGQRDTSGWRTYDKGQYDCIRIFPGNANNNTRGLWGNNDPKYGKGNNIDNMAFGDIKLRELNFENAEEAIRNLPMCQYARVNPLGYHDYNNDDKKYGEGSIGNLPYGIIIEEGNFDLENAPYVIKTAVSAMLEPKISRRDKLVKFTDKVDGLEDAMPDGYFEPQEKQVSHEDAWKRALELYKEYGRDLGLEHPKTYKNIDYCLYDYNNKISEFIERENSYQEPVDWYELNDKGYFDEY